MYPCFLPDLGELTGAGRIRLTRCKNMKIQLNGTGNTEKKAGNDSGLSIRCEPYPKFTHHGPIMLYKRLGELIYCVDCLISIFTDLSSLTRPVVAGCAGRVVFYRSVVANATRCPGIKCLIRLCLCHLVTLSPCHLVTLSPCHLVTLSPCHLVTCSFINPKYFLNSFGFYQKNPTFAQT